MEFDQPRRVLAAAILACMLFPVAWCLYSGTSRDETMLIYGTWTDPNGPEGNNLRLYLLERKLPNNPVPVMKVYEGKLALHKLLGHEDIETGCNFESIEPLRLSVFQLPEADFAAVKLVDANHMLIRFGKDLDALSRPDALAHPETLRLVRTAN